MRDLIRPRVGQHRIDGLAHERANLVLSRRGHRGQRHRAGQLEQFRLETRSILSGSSDIVLMISMIVFSISCVDMLLAMYLAVVVSSSSAIGFPCAIWFATADYRASRERFRSPWDGRAAWVIGGHQLRFQRVAFDA